ncbi:MAG TPA: hypothetical protein VH186_30160 [Chloroflexia bacterium]|nr:hypothetical protein [Chloroflexia bacterium]
MDFKPESIILREREPDNKNKPTGWLVILCGLSRERELLAIFTCEVGLDNVRQFTELLTKKYHVLVREELPSYHRNYQSEEYHSHY